MGRFRSVKLMSDASGKYLVPNITNTELTTHLSDKKPIVICINNLGTILSGNTLDSTDDRLPVFSVSEKLQNANVLIELVQLGKDIKNLNNFFQKNSISFLMRTLRKKSSEIRFLPDGTVIGGNDPVYWTRPINLWGSSQINNFRYAFAESKIYSNPEDFYLECQDGKSRKGPISFDPYDALPPGETMVPRFDLINALCLIYGSDENNIDLTGIFYKTEFCGKINPYLFSENKYIHENAFHIEKEQNDDCIILNADGTRYNPYDVIPKDWNGNL